MSGSLNLQNVKVNLSLVNGLGVDARLTLTKLTSYNSHTNTTVNLMDNAIVNSAINVNRAIETNNPASPVTPAIHEFSITPSNSNILPGLIIYLLLLDMPCKLKPILWAIFPARVILLIMDMESILILISMSISLIANNLTLADTLV